MGAYAMAHEQAVQIESAAPACVSCRGEGSLLFPSCDHAGQNCACGEGEEVVCPRCDGTRVEPCTHCGERSTGRDWLTKQPVCAACARPEEPGDDYLLREWDEPAEMRRQLEAARRLK